MNIAVADPDEDPFERLLNNLGKEGAARSSSEELLLRAEELRRSVESLTASTPAAEPEDEETKRQREEARRERRAKDEAVARKLADWLRARRDEHGNQS
ncbi:MAG: hypothetical protein ACRD82_10790 [Blastocatellia bacterium]